MYSLISLIGMQSLTLKLKASIRIRIFEIVLYLPKDIITYLFEVIKGQVSRIDIQFIYYL